MGYSFKAPNRTFEEAGQLLLANPDVADLMVTHRFPLEGVSEAFAQAKDRSGGAIKVAFDVS
jgi:threonine dehydrogenase-like Zn-dependent dehydrogenase